MHYSRLLYYFNLHFNMLASSPWMFAKARISETGSLYSGMGTMAPVPLLSLQSLVGLSGDAPRTARSSRSTPHPSLLSLSNSPWACSLERANHHPWTGAKRGKCMQRAQREIMGTSELQRGPAAGQTLLLCTRYGSCMSRPMTSNFTALHPQESEAEWRGG